MSEWLQKCDRISWLLSDEKNAERKRRQIFLYILYTTRVQKFLYH